MSKKTVCYGLIDIDIPKQAGEHDRFEQLGTSTGQLADPWARTDESPWLGQQSTRRTAASAEATAGRGGSRRSAAPAARHPQRGQAVLGNFQTL